MTWVALDHKAEEVMIYQATAHVDVDWFSFGALGTTPLHLVCMLHFHEISSIPLQRLDYLLIALVCLRAFLNGELEDRAIAIKSLLVALVFLSHRPRPL